MLEPLSSEFLTALSSGPTDEINQLLCSSLELNQQLQKQAAEASQKPYDDTTKEDEEEEEQQQEEVEQDTDRDEDASSSSSHNVARITKSQAVLLLNTIVSQSPSFAFTNNNVSDHQTVVVPPPPPVQLLTNIRNLCKILALSQERHSISSSGILSKLQQSCQLYCVNPILYIEFLDCCLLAGQYHYARKYMDQLDHHPWSSSSSSSSKEDSSSGIVTGTGSGTGSGSGTGTRSTNTTVYPHIVTSVQGGDGEYTPTLVFARYHYIRGMVYYACDELSSAIVEWGHCLEIPCSMVGGSKDKTLHVILCTWKKWVLAKCLLCQYDEDENDENGGHDERGINYNRNVDKEEKERGGGEGKEEEEEWEGKKNREQLEEETLSKRKRTNNVIDLSIKKLILTLPRGTSSVLRRLLQGEGEGRKGSKKNVSLVASASSSEMQPATSSTGANVATTAARTNSRGSMEQEVELYKMLVADFVHGDLDILFQNKDKSGRFQLQMQFFERDGNVGMIKRLLPVMRWRTLRKISKIYSEISIQELSNKMNMSPLDCMEFLLQVAWKQDLHRKDYRTPIDFRVDDGTGVVYLEEEDMEQENMMYVEKKLGESIALANRVKDLDVSIASSSRYQMNLIKYNLEESKRIKMRGGGGESSGRSVIDLS